MRKIVICKTARLSLATRAILLFYLLFYLLYYLSGDYTCYHILVYYHVSYKLPFEMSYYYYYYAITTGTQLYIIVT